MTWRPLSADAQDTALRRVTTEWRRRDIVLDGCIWEGPVEPLSRIYIVRLTYFPRRYFDGWCLENPYVRINVIDPPIGALARKAGRRLPHVYQNAHDSNQPGLCVFDPAAGEWNPSMALVDTIIPWTSEWLFFYEGWEIDGVFGGRGRHPEAPEETCQTEPNLVAAELSAHAAFHSYGQREGGFASFPLMAAASAGSSLPPYWPGWRHSTRAAVRSRLSSILSPERRLAA